MLAAVVTSCSADRTPEEQIAAGDALYQQVCANCHNSEGGIGPRLEPAVLRAYGTPQAIHTYIKVAMPYDAPGSLTNDDYWDVVAYLIHRAGLWDGSEVLGGGTETTEPLND